MSTHAGHVAVVTGGSGGIGLGMARGLAKAGADVAIWARNEEKTAAALAELRALGVRAEGIRCDVANEDDVRAATAATLERLGRIDFVFANAAVMGVAPTHEMTTDEWRRVLSVNLDGVFFTVRAASAHMIARGGGGRIVLVSSIGAEFGMARQLHYAASKGAMLSMTRALAVELARHDVQVNCIVPGWIETEMTEAARGWEKLNAEVVRRTPARRWGTPEDFEAIAAYLCSPGARFQTGTFVRLDGGYSVY